MSEQKLSLEEILDEYSPDTDGSPTPHVGRAAAQKVINSTLLDPVKKQTETPKRPAVSHERRELFDEPA